MTPPPASDSGGPAAQVKWIVAKSKGPRLEREQTDQSLRVEREKADLALLEKQAAVELDADQVVRQARVQADAVLAAARNRADRQLGEMPPAVETSAIVEEERVLQDEALQDERDSADETLQQERNATSRTMRMLLPLVRDKTDRYLLTERARSDDAVANRDDFLAIVSHDLRNLLGGIVVSAEQLSRSPAQGEQRRRTLDETSRIQRYCGRMDRLIGDLLDVVSIDAGKLAIAPTRGEWTALIAEAVDTFHPAAMAKGISLQSEIVESPLSSDFDHDRMLQVLANLLTNAIKFTPSGGEIRIRAERAGDEVRLSVRDTGIGIPAALLEAVFERFWQIGKNDHRGVGLGLYISRCLVEAHGGKIRAQSDSGQGSTFCLTLPAKVPVA